jgi:hypothetical protein
MTGDQSRLLKVGDRVCWGATMTDLGMAVGVAWSGITIEEGSETARPLKLHNCQYRQIDGTIDGDSSSNSLRRPI